MIDITSAILCLVAYLPKEMIQTEITSQTSLLHSVSSYFSSDDMMIARFGAVIAESISGITGNPIETGLLDNNEELKFMKELVNVTDAFLGNTFILNTKREK